MRNSAEPLGGSDPIMIWLCNYLIERCIFVYVIPTLILGIKMFSTKLKFIPTIRIDFPSGTKTVFFINMPEGNLIQLKKILTQELDLHGQMFPPINPTDQTEVNIALVRTKVHGSGQEYLIKHVLQSYGLKISKIIRERKSMLPRIEIIQF